jgi:hypothetical protein
MSFFPENSKGNPFASYDEYTSALFACVDRQLHVYLNEMEDLFASENGGFKNVLYPDIEIAHDLTEKHLRDFSRESDAVIDGEIEKKDEVEQKSTGKDSHPDAETDADLDNELASLFSNLADQGATAQPFVADTSEHIDDLMNILLERARKTDPDKVSMPFYRLCDKRGFSNFTTF